MPPKKKTQLEKQHEKFAARYAARKKLGGLGVPGMYGPLTMDQAQRINRTGKRLAAIQDKALRAEAIRARKEGTVQRKKDRAARKRDRMEGLVQRKKDRAARKAMLAMFKADPPVGYGGIRGIKQHRGNQYEKFIEKGILPDIDHANHIYFQELARRKGMYAALKARRAAPGYVARPRKAKDLGVMLNPRDILPDALDAVKSPVVELVRKAAETTKKAIGVIQSVAARNNALERKGKLMERELKELKRQKKSKSPPTTTRSRSAGRPKRATKAPSKLGYP